MTRILQLVIVLVLLAGIGLVFISPALNLQPTAMRARQAAQMTMMAIAVSASILAGLCAEQNAEPLAVDTLAILRTNTDFVDLNCSRLC